MPRTQTYKEPPLGIPGVPGFQECLWEAHTPPVYTGNVCLAPNKSLFILQLRIYAHKPLISQV